MGGFEFGGHLVEDVQHSPLRFRKTINRYGGTDILD